MQKKKLISMVLSICILIGAMTPGVAAAAMPEDLTGQTAYLAVHETGGSYAGLGGPSSLTVTAPGGAVISPVGNVYSNVPAGSALRLDLVFHLNDGDGEGVLYEYSGSSYFTVTLPEGITFASPSGEEANIYAVDESGGDPWLLGTWSFTGPNVIRVDFGPDVAAHTGMWGSIGIDGTFDAVGTGGDTETELVLGSQHITFTREVPPPAAIGIAKEGAYNPDDNTITWTVTITPPGSPSSLAGYTLVDTYSGNQSYQAGSFRHGAAVIADGGLDLTVADQISYTFPAGTEGEQTVTYKTSPDTFAAETGIDNVEASVFSNAASLKLGTEPAAGPATAEVTVDWISKSGTAVTADDPIVIRWQVDIAVPSGGSITGASIVDTLPAGLKLIENSGTYPIQISVNGGGAAAVPEGAGAGTYTYGYTGSGDPSTLSYRFPEADGVDGKLAGTARFTYYTEVTDREAYLNNNGAISSQNSAGLLWTLMPGATPPTDTASAGVVGEGGLLSKTAGSTQDYAHPGVIHWTITVNRNKISVPDAAIADTVPAGQELLIDAEHPFTVRKARAVQAQAATASGIPGLASGDGFVREFSYTFQDDPVTDTYTVDYYTRITDIGTLYANSPSGAPVGFGNAVALTRTGETVTADGTQYYNSQMLAKAVAEAYDYTNHVTKWRLTVNRNRLPLTNAVVTDTLPAGMALLIDAQHPFAVVENGPDGSDTPIAAAPTTGVNGGNSFTYAFGSTATTSQYTITFYTLLTDEALLSQWGGNKAFTNHAELDADEIAAPIGASATVNVRNPVISKSRAYAEGSDHIDWSVVINPGKMTLRSASVTDVLAEGLQLDPGSVKLYSVAVAADGTAAPASEGTLMTGGYTLDLPAAANGNTLTLTLPDNSSATYRLEFTTFVLSDDLDFTNTVSLTGSAGSPEGGASAQNIVINNLWSSGGSGSNTLTVHKEDGAGNPVAGAAYQLLNFNMQPVLKSGNPIKAVTDANGDAVFTNLPAWIFYAKEISAPDGYLLNPEPFGGGRLSGNTVLETTDQKAMGEIGFNKTSTVGRPLDGGEFELTGTDYAGNPVLKTASAVNGAVTFTGVPLGEGYVIRETVPPSGYYRTDTELVAYVRYNGGRTGAVTGVTPDTLTNEPTPSAPSGKYGSISLRKTDAAGAPLSGAEFVLIDSAGSIIQRAVSQDSGLVLFTDVPLGAYTIRESKAPAGYAPSAAAITAAVKTAGSSVHASPYTVVNNRTEGAAIHITKVSSVTGEVLAGAEFTLYDAAGKAVRKAVTDIGGAALFADLAPGVYTVKETDAPDGYIAAGKTLSVTAQSRALYPFTVENDPALLNPPKTDGISGILGSIALGAALLGAAAVLAGKRRRGRGAANR